MQINVPKELTLAMQEKLMDWMQRKHPDLLKRYTVNEFGELLEHLKGMDAYDAAMTLDQQGWRSDTELVFVLAGRAC